MARRWTPRHHRDHRWARQALLGAPKSSFRQPINDDVEVPVTPQTTMRSAARRQRSCNLAPVAAERRRHRPRLAALRPGLAPRYRQRWHRRPAVQLRMRRQRAVRRQAAQGKRPAKRHSRHNSRLGCKSCPGRKRSHHHNLVNIGPPPLRRAQGQRRRPPRRCSRAMRRHRTLGLRRGRRPSPQPLQKHGSRSLHGRAYRVRSALLRATEPPARRPPIRSSAKVNSSRHPN